MKATNLAGAMRALGRDRPEHKARVALTIERPIKLDGVATPRFSGETVAALLELVPVGRN